MEAIKFAEWLAENHYALHDIINGIYYWKDEYGIRTSEYLYNEFKNNK